MYFGLANGRGDVWQSVKRIVQEEKRDTSIFIGYNIPGRDNSNYSSGGLHSAQEFWDWYGAIADAIADEKAIVIVEPDALGLGEALSADKRKERLEMLQGAVNALANKPNVKIYVDASMWISVERNAELLNQINNVDGFSLNVSGWATTEKCIAYGNKLSKLTNLPYVIDTSRNANGNPHEPAWCNVTDTKVGVEPTTETASAFCDAYLWLKVPGESDGLKINGHDQDGRKNWPGVIPNAGARWVEFEKAIYSGDWSEFKTKYKEQM